MENGDRIIPDAPSFTDDEIRHCRESGDFRPILFEWYKFIGSLTVILAYIKRESPSFRPIPRMHYQVLVGLLNRCARLMLSNIALSHEGQFGEATSIVDRCIFESAVKIIWLLQKPTDDRFNRFLADGLRTEIEFKDRIESNIAARDATTLPIELRMLRSIANHMAAAGMTDAIVASTKKLPDMASMIDSLGFDRLLYVVGQRIGSHHVHGTWPSLLFHYLEEQKGETPFLFVPRAHPCDMHINQYMFVSLVMLEAMKRYVEYAFNETDYISAFVGLLNSVEEEIHNIYSEATADD